MCFWFDKGIDGFRMDVIPLISKRWDFPPSESMDFAEVIVTIYANGPRIHEFLQEMFQEVMVNYDVMTVGEGIGVTKAFCLDYVGEDRSELNMLYHFDHMQMDVHNGNRLDPKKWKLSEFKRIFREWHEALGENI